MTSEELMARLAEPFPEDDIEWRIMRTGRARNDGVWASVLAYVTNRAIMERLDSVVGPMRWRNEYAAAPGQRSGILCGISIWADEYAEWVTKWDGAEQSDIEPVKGGLSNAMKRAAVQWGIGRYLYRLPETYAVLSENGMYRGMHKDEKGVVKFKWNPPLKTAEYGGRSLSLSKDV